LRRIVDTVAVVKQTMMNTTRMAIDQNSLALFKGGPRPRGAATRAAVA
jgi:hypothetical protein